MKGVEQTKRAISLLKHDPQLGRKLERWFPGSRVPDVSALQFVGAVVTSNRMFTGLELDDIPIRDFFSFATTIESGCICVGDLRGTTAIQHKIRYWRGADFSVDDLIGYLHPDGRYWSLRGLSIREVTRLDILSRRVTLARKTYVTELSTSLEETLEEFAQAGFDQVDTSETSRTPPVTADELKSFTTSIA